MNNTRDEILKTIHQRGQVTVRDLSEAVNVSQMAVRHHLASLQAQGLIVSEDGLPEGDRRVGRPVHVFTLTAAGQENFPQRYVQLSTALLAEIRNHLPPEMIEAIFNRMAEGRAAEIARGLQGLSLEDKLQQLVKLLGTEGFAAEWNMVGEHYHITEHNCPYLVVGQHHPEVCHYDRTLISTLLAVPVVQQECVLAGGDKCVFVVQPLRA